MTIKKKIKYPTDLLLHRLVELQVEQRPEEIALICEDKTLTYQELDNRANQLAHYLRSQGVRPEVIVGLSLERSLEMGIGILGILKAGGAVLPLDPEFPKERIDFMLKDAQVSLIVTQKPILKRLPPHKANVLCIDTDWEFIAQECKTPPISEVTSENLSIVVYTSGSTGKPKGVMLPHRAYCSRVLWAQSTYQLTETDRFLVKAFKIFWPLWAGGKAVIPKPAKYQDINYLVNLIAEQNITVCFVVPSMLTVLLEAPGINNCSCLKHIFCSGEPLSLKLQESLFACLDAELHNLYGPTEASYATFWDCKQGDNQQFVPIGRPTDDMEVYILNSDLKRVSIGEKGELYIGGIALARGYLNKPELTASKFSQSPFSDNPEIRLFKTGDLARFLPDGNIELLGRIDHQVKIRGFRVELWEVESILAQYPAVREVVVIAYEEVPETKYLIAYIVFHQEQVPTITELRRFLSDKLPDYMIPSNFIILDALPLTPNGKVDRQSLPSPSQTRPYLGEGFLAPRYELETQLTKIWEDVLSVQPIGVKDNFFDLGGNSLNAMRLLSEIISIFNKNLSLSLLVQNPTIEKLASILQTQGQETKLVSLDLPSKMLQNGSRLPFFCLDGFSLDVVKYLDSNQPFFGMNLPNWDEIKNPRFTIQDLAYQYIDEIRTIQTSGPYLLGGHCYGGTVAFEIAQQLQLQGEKVAMLILFNPVMYTDVGLLFYVDRLLFRLHELWLMESKYKVNFILERMKSIKGIIVGKLRVFRHKRLREKHRLNKSYVYQPYRGKIVIFLHQDKESILDNRISLLKKVGEKPVIEYLPHLVGEYFKDPLAEILAQKLTYYLNKV